MSLGSNHAAPPRPGHRRTRTPAGTPRRRRDARLSCGARSGQHVGADWQRPRRLHPAPVADVVVTATSPALQGEQVVVTDASGLYRVPQLPPGTYTLRFEKETYRPYTRTGIEVDRGPHAATQRRAAAGVAGSETVTVVGTPPVVDVGSSHRGTTINNDFVRNLAVARPNGLGGANRSFDSLASTAPMAANDLYGVSISGSSEPGEPVPDRRDLGERPGLRGQRLTPHGGVHRRGERHHWRVHARVRTDQRRRDQRHHQVRGQRVPRLDLRHLHARRAHRGAGTADRRRRHAEHPEHPRSRLHLGHRCNPGRLHHQGQALVLRRRAVRQAALLLPPGVPEGPGRQQRQLHHRSGDRPAALRPDRSATRDFARRRAGTTSGS